MIKADFKRKIKDNDLNIGEYQIELHLITDAPYVMGCCFDGGVWKVYKTRERLGHYIIKEYKNESDAFHCLYELVLAQHRRTISIET